MSKKQLKQAHVLRNYNEKVLTRKAAAEALGLSERHITRLAKELKQHGERALLHKNIGRTPVHALPAHTKATIAQIRSLPVYKDCNVSHFQELLQSQHRITISYSALYRLLQEAGIKSPKQHHSSKGHRRRKRKAAAGELLQIDASPFDWLGDGKQYALHGTIDDATGQITGLYMTENECLQGYFEVMRQTCLQIGVPLSVYSDKHTIFRSPLTAKQEDNGEEANLTQFGRALSELGINIIHAHSPQAKGRIERLWETLQSRLPVELRLRHIATLQQVNSFLVTTYIPLFNERFAVAATAATIFLPYTHSEDIDNILCVKVTRKMDNAGSFSFQNRSFKVLDNGYPLIPAKASVEVLIGVRQALRIRYNGRIFDTILFLKPPIPSVKPKQKKSKLPDVEAYVKPYLLHSSEQWKRVWHYESYADSLAFIHDLFFRAYA